MENDFKVKFINCEEKDLKEIGFDKTYTKKGLNKHRFKTFKIYNLSCAQANIIKQTALSSGTDCAVHKEVITGRVELSHCILTGTVSQFEKIIEKLKFQPLKLSSLGKQLKSLLFDKKEPLMIRDIIIEWDKKPIIMGILNITPDSFSDGGLYNNTDDAINHYKEMLHDGADIIDIGGESTRPFSQKITVEEEISRVIPIIEKIRTFDKNTILSVDTRNALTAKKVLEAGADMVNDISALDWDKEMLNVIKEKNCPIILNHSTGSPDVMQKKTKYSDVIDTIYDYLQDKINLLIQEGIEKANIIIDPGIGFGKTTEQNFEIIKRIEELSTLGCAILAGHSRKNFLKETINSDNLEDLDDASAIISQRLIESNVNIIRVHNIKKNKMLVDIEKLFI